MGAAFGNSQLLVSTEFSWKLKQKSYFHSKLENPSSGRWRLLLTSILKKKTSLLDHKCRHCWSAGFVIVRGGSSAASPVQGSWEHSNTTRFGWDHPDIPGKTYPSPKTINVSNIKMIIMIKNPRMTYLCLPPILSLRRWEPVFHMCFIPLSTLNRKPSMNSQSIHLSKTFLYLAGVEIVV